MNEYHKEILGDLKDEIDEVYGDTAKWILKSGEEKDVVGTFTSEIKVSNSGNKNSNVRADYKSAFFAMRPDSVPGEKGDTFRIHDQLFTVGKFKAGSFETVIPLLKYVDPNIDF